MIIDFCVQNEKIITSVSAIITSICAIITAGYIIKNSSKHDENIEQAFNKFAEYCSLLYEQHQTSTTLSRELFHQNIKPRFEVERYNLVGKFQDVVLYLKNDDSSYMVKRILDNEKEYEYAICGDTGFVLKQCDGKCNCHEVVKNDRPKDITLCSSYQLDSAMSCLIDEKIKKVYMSSYFSLIGQTKIDDYYLMDYFCKNKTYQRGNYKNSQKYYSANILLLFILILLGI